ncbi:MAG: 4a-hydroxytetrahydrobiopterin dehydratase [Saprospiraceae bacterium]|nr:4a-hydroxytetrahydrobiopterin dehydratase [Saprospiraceae bacterium]
MWEEKDNALHTSLKFKNFREAFAFMTEVAIECEKLNHHPRWTNVWNTIDIELNTHSAGNIVTELDHKLAKKIESIFSKYKLKLAKDV